MYVTDRLTSAIPPGAAPRHDPKDPLGRHLALTKLDEDYERYVDLFARRGHTRQEPIHPLGMMELDAGLFGNAVFGGDAIE